MGRFFFVFFALVNGFLLMILWRKYGFDAWWLGLAIFIIGGIMQAIFKNLHD